MICPKCGCEMQALESESFSAAKCTGCTGIWFRAGDHEIAKTIKGAAAIDSNSVHAQAVYNDVRDISCPDCDRKMTKMIDRDQLHIQFEACSYCKGVFLDSGEFKDLTEFTTIERVKQSIAILRANLSA